MKAWRVVLLLALVIAAPASAQAPVSQGTRDWYRIPTPGSGIGMALVVALGWVTRRRASHGCRSA